MSGWEREDQATGRPPRQGRESVRVVGTSPFGGSARTTWDVSARAGWSSRPNSYPSWRHPPDPDSAPPSRAAIASRATTGSPGVSGPGAGPDPARRTKGGPSRRLQLLRRRLKRAPAHGEGLGMSWRVVRGNGWSITAPVRTCRSDWRTVKREGAGQAPGHYPGGPGPWRSPRPSRPWQCRLKLSPQIQGPGGPASGGASHKGWGHPGGQPQTRPPTRHRPQRPEDPRPARCGVGPLMLGLTTMSSTGPGPACPGQTRPPGGAPTASGRPPWSRLRAASPRRPESRRRGTRRG